MNKDSKKEYTKENFLASHHKSLTVVILWSYTECLETANNLHHATFIDLKCLVCLCNVYALVKIQTTLEANAQTGKLQDIPQVTDLHHYLMNHQQCLEDGNNVRHATIIDIKCLVCLCIILNSCENYLLNVKYHQTSLN